MTDRSYEERQRIEKMRYRLKTIEDERRIARAAEKFASAINSHYEPVVFTRGFFQILFRKEGVPKQVTFELSADEAQLLQGYLADQAFGRRRHADALEKAVAFGDESS